MQREKQHPYLCRCGISEPESPEAKQVHHIQPASYHLIKNRNQIELSRYHMHELRQGKQRQNRLPYRYHYDRSGVLHKHSLHPFSTEVTDAREMHNTQHPEHEHEGTRSWTVGM